jgi:FkbH-like protein
MLQSASSLEDYLVDLQLQAEIGIPGKKEIPRVSQLTLKTNQFNLTTYRYTEGEIQDFVESPHSEVYYLRLADRISDLGIVGVVIVKFEEDYAEIDSFLFSCRALGRGVEDALLCFVVNQVIEKGKKRIEGTYLPTQKNSQVAYFYQKNGFQLIKEKEGSTHWSFSIAPEMNSQRTYPKWITVKHLS